MLTYGQMKQMLDEIGDKRRLANSLMRQIGQAREEADCLHGVNYSAMPRGGENTPAAQRFVEKVERLEERLAAISDELTALEQAFDDVLDALTPQEQTIIRERYFLGKRWRAIQREMKYEEAQPYRIARSAIEKMAKSFKNSEVDSK